MSDLRPDPIDKAYVEAEAVLSDEAERAARRARVLAAVAEAPAAAPVRARPPLWRRGGWLVAASVTGLAVIVASQVYRPLTPPPNRRPSAAAELAPTNSATTIVSSRPPAQIIAPPKAVPQPGPEPVIVASPPASPVVSPDVEPPALRGSPSVGSAPPPPPPAASPPPAPAPAQGGVVASLQPPAASGAAADSGAADNNTDSVSEMVVTAERRQQSIQRVPTAISAFTGKQRDVVGINSTQDKPAAPDEAQAGVRLRAAAAAGRTTDVEALLEQGAPVDAPDANGDTALIKAVRADHPDTAALLRRHGASLDHKNHAGQSARDLAKAKGDPALDQALGLSP